TRDACFEISEFPEACFFLDFQEFRCLDFTELGIWLFGSSNRWTRYDWDRLSNTRDDRLS
ncbi:MAG: hypothetical protein ACI9G1_004904, partial [Pirellulaceae bacterium]